MPKFGHIRGPSVRDDKKRATSSYCLRLHVVPEQMVRSRGLEPPRPDGHKNLNLARLPIPPRPLVTDNRVNYNRSELRVQDVDSATHFVKNFFVLD